MAPSKEQMVHTIDRTPEYNEFMAKLGDFHEKRGTKLEADPKIGPNHVDLFKVYTHIVKNGGYDKISDEKLAWRRMAEDLGLMTNNAPAAAFQLKSIFYKNLAAYEILHEHGQEPPPPSILEHVSAKGSGLLSRTLENYTKRDFGASNEASGDDGTPVRDRRGDETPGSGRAARGLREAPPQRVPFQPDTNPSRQTRHASSGQHSSTNNTMQPSHVNNHPMANHPYHPHPVPHQVTPIHPPQHGINGGRISAAYNPGEDYRIPTVERYEPPRITPMGLRAVETPSNSPEVFARRARILGAKVAGLDLNANPLNRPPGTHAEGTNIYVRCLNSLRSGIKEEQQYGLHHLVKISFERGDKYKFDQFPGLSDGLVEKALEVGSLYYEVEWYIKYDADSDELGPGELDGFEGTRDILERIAKLKPKQVVSTLLPADFADELVMITEAMLTIRNMVMLPDNAISITYLPALKDLLCIVLNLPKVDTVVEIKHFALDIAEQILPYMALDSEDPLYRSLLSLVIESDRGMILGSLRSLTRISLSLEAANKLGNVPAEVLERIMYWLLLNDEELTDTILDFLYQYTAVVPNVENLLKSVNAEQLVAQLVRLLSHGAKRVHKEIAIEPERRIPATEEVSPCPPDLLLRLLETTEPERCFEWLKCFFEEDADSQITQIAIWHAYTHTFADALKQRGGSMINAAEFIRHISQVYKNAGAQIVREGPAQETKFIIRGIRPRLRPIDRAEGREYLACSWQVGEPGPRHQSAPTCRALFPSPKGLWEHVLTDHLHETSNEKGLFTDKPGGSYACLWQNCTKYPQPATIPLNHFMAHIKVHVRNEERRRSRAAAAANEPTLLQNPSGNKQRRQFIVPAKTMRLTYEETATVRDETSKVGAQQPAGIPMSAVLVLRNLARNVVKTESEAELLKQAEQGAGEPGGWNERLFRNVMHRLFEIATANRAFPEMMTSLIQQIGLN